MRDSSYKGIHYNRQLWNSNWFLHCNVYSQNSGKTRAVVSNERLFQHLDGECPSTVNRWHLNNSTYLLHFQCEIDPHDKLQLHDINIKWTKIFWLSLCFDLKNVCLNVYLLFKITSLLLWKYHLYILLQFAKLSIRKTQIFIRADIVIFTVNIIILLDVISATEDLGLCIKSSIYFEHLCYWLPNTRVSSDSLVQ